MAHLLRWAFNIATALSAILLVATCVLWVRSYIIWDDFTWQRPNSLTPQNGQYYWEAEVGNGRFFADRVAWQLPPMPLTHSTSPPATGGIGLVGDGLVRLGFAINFDRSGMRQWYTLDANGVPVPGGSAYFVGDGGLKLLEFPWWFPAVLFAVFPAFWLMSAVRRPRGRPGFCRSCGYDLRATPDKCPECGRVPKAARTA